MKLQNVYLNLKGFEGIDRTTRHPSIVSLYQNFINSPSIDLSHGISDDDGNLQRYIENEYEITTDDDNKFIFDKRMESTYDNKDNELHSIKYDYNNKYIEKENNIVYRPDNGTLKEYHSTTFSSDNDKNTECTDVEYDNDGKVLKIVNNNRQSNIATTREYGYGENAFTSTYNIYSSDNVLKSKNTEQTITDIVDGKSIVTEFLFKEFYDDGQVINMIIKESKYYTTKTGKKNMLSSNTTYQKGPTHHTVFEYDDHDRILYNRNTCDDDNLKNIYTKHNDFVSINDNLLVQKTYIHDYKESDGKKRTYETNYEIFIEFDSDKRITKITHVERDNNATVEINYINDDFACITFKEDERNTIKIVSMMALKRLCNVSEYGSIITNLRVSDDEVINFSYKK